MRIALLLLAALTLALPGPVQAQSPTLPTPLRVVASFSILADMARQVGEDRVTVRALAGPDQDLHGFEPRPSDIQAVAQADVLIVNGLGLEGWAKRIADAAGFHGVTVVATRGIATRDIAARAGPDPHAWQDLANARQYVANIRDGLVAADPARAPATTAAAARYRAELAALDSEIRALFAAIPRAQRRIVTSHDAFAYFAAAYGIDMHAVSGTWRDAEPSARELATLAAQVKRQNIRALFLENAGNPAALRALASETNTKIGGQLYADALSPPNGPAATYTAMMRHNAQTIAAALR
ncbi:MAG: zinc ABC transporter substrate-binding protein [Acetobacteraceae bacterium]|nr:zinc ABC transporter substrate-binding protein [Acetobacteraceae bacterium]